MQTSIQVPIRPFLNSIWEIIKTSSMQADKVLCCMFLLALPVVEPAQNFAKHKTWLPVLIQLTNSSIAII